VTAMRRERRDILRSRRLGCLLARPLNEYVRRTPSGTMAGSNMRREDRSPRLFCLCGVVVGFASVFYLLDDTVAAGDLNPAVAVLLGSCGGFGLGIALDYWGDAGWEWLVKWLRRL
jgi:hypothetical protein